MTGDLRRAGFCDHHKHVERLTAANAIYARDGRRRNVRTTIPDVSAAPLPDLMKRDFRRYRSPSGSVTHLQTSIPPRRSRTWYDTNHLRSCESVVARFPGLLVAPDVNRSSREIFPIRLDRSDTNHDCFRLSSALRPPLVSYLTASQCSQPPKVCRTTI